jgi:hypothetical protein
MEEVRHQTENGDANLEDLFLRLTGGIIEREMDAILE